MIPEDKMAELRIKQNEILDEMNSARGTGEIVEYIYELLVDRIVNDYDVADDFYDVIVCVKKSSGGTFKQCWLDREKRLRKEGK